MHSTWNLNYAAHLGFPTRATPWLAQLAGSPDPVDQIACAADHGFIGMADLELVSREAEEQLRIGRALRHHGLHLTSYVAEPQATLQPWHSPHRDHLVALRKSISRALEAGKRAGAQVCLVTAGIDPARDKASQLEIFADHLGQWALDQAENAGIRLCVEAISPSRLGGALITRTSEAVKLARATGGRLGLVFDTVHVAAEGDDLVETFVAARDHVAIVQLADLPGRVEPGAGTLHLSQLLRVVKNSGFSGPVELEHQHSTPGVGGERKSLARLAELDAVIP